MPIAYLYPDSTESNTNWTVDAGNTLHGTLATTESDSGSPPTPNDDDDIIAAADGAQFVVTLDDIHLGNLNVNSVDSIQVQGLHYNVTKGNVSNYTVEIVLDGTTLYTETSSNVFPNDSYTVWNLVAKTIHPDGSVWTGDDLNGLKLDVIGNVSAGEMRLNYIRLAVNYTENLPIYESGEPNMNVEEGIITVDEGIVIL